MDEPKPLDQPDSPADMGEVKSICSLIQAGRITWNDLVAFDSSSTVKAPDWTNSPEEEVLIRNLRAHLTAKCGFEENFDRVTDALITHLFYRSLPLPPTFKAVVDSLKVSA